MTREDRDFYIEYRADLRRALKTLTHDPTASASISVGGGSKSYTRQNLAALQAELARVENLLAVDAASRKTTGGIGVNYARWCG